MFALFPPYEIERYAGIWECPPASVDLRHLFWLADVLSSGLFQNALEIGCLNGASSTAFVEAINVGRLDRATFCDIDLRDHLKQVLANCRDPSRVTTFWGRSAELLSQPPRYDFVFVDGDHRWAAVAEEVDWLVAQQPMCVMAHDTAAEIAGIPDCGGPQYLKWRFQTLAPYFCLEDNAVRAEEGTFRGMFLATTSSAVFEVARASLRRRCAVEPCVPEANP